MTESPDTEWHGYQIYVQPGGCVELAELEATEEHDGGFLHICDWGGLVAAVSAEIDRRKPYRDPRKPE